MKNSKKKYSNPYFENLRLGFFHFLLWQCGYYKDPHTLTPIPDDFSYPNSQDSLSHTAPQVTWINHSTFLVRLGRWNFLTDPIWSKRCSPFSFFGPIRHSLPPIPIDKLPLIDFVLISHNHYDHLDKQTIKLLTQQFPQLRWILPKGVKKWFQRHFSSTPSSQLIELNWWETVSLEDNFFLTGVPAQHFSGRGFFDRNRTLWSGYVIQSARKGFYFAGDTGYNAFDFKEIGKRFGPLDLSLLPIGSYVPRRLMSPVHVHPEEAVCIHKDVNSRLSVGGHWGTFKLSEEALDRPPYDLYVALQQAGLSCETFRVLNPGQTINW